MIYAASLIFILTDARALSSAFMREAATMLATKADIDDIILFRRLTAGGADDYGREPKQRFDTLRQ